MSDLPSNAPSPRVCHILKWSDFDGYGFNLHADKTRPGQYIGKVDENSPADVAGLKEGDRIIEVNGVNIANENHKQVVQRIKAVSNETKLLVVDSESDRWYKDHNLVVRGDQPNIIYKSSQRSSDSPESQKSSDKVKNGNAHEEDNKSLVSSSSTHSEHSTQPQLNEVLPQDSDEISDKEPIAALKIEDKETDLPEPPPVLDEQNTSEIPLDSDLSLEYDNIRFEHEEEHKMPPIPKVYVEESHSLSSRSSSRSDDVSKVDNETTGSIPESDPDPEQEHEERKSPMSTTPSPPPSLNPEAASGNKNSTSQNSSPSQNSSGLNLNMTVAEMRAHLATKKKFDPRNDAIDLKKKYQIVQNM